MKENITDWFEIPVAEGQVLAANVGRRVTLADGRTGVICHNDWVGVSDGPHHQVSLDLGSNNASAQTASLDAAAIVRRALGGCRHEG